MVALMQSVHVVVRHGTSSGDVLGHFGVAMLWEVVMESVVERMDVVQEGGCLV